MEDQTVPKNIVVVGASAGGLHSIIELSAQLTLEMDLSLFVVLHITHISMEDVLIQRIQKNTSFTCKMAVHEEIIQTRHLYFAVPDKHMVLQGNKIVLGKGPAENRWRPSIDVLFRSAAASYDGRVIGIILSGLMQDGASGMLAIKRCGGTCIVQDPKETEYPDMAMAVLNSMEVDYCLSLQQMGTILLEKSKNGKYTAHSIPDDIKAEATIAARVSIGMENVKRLGQRSHFSCPDCGGGLWEMVDDDVIRYRCYTGHVYNEGELWIRQSETLENTLWMALRMMEERKQLLEKIAEEEGGKGWIRMAASKKERVIDLQSHIERLKQILFDAKSQVGAD